MEIWLTSSKLNQILFLKSKENVESPGPSLPEQGFPCWLELPRIHCRVSHLPAFSLNLLLKLIKDFIVIGRRNYVNKFVLIFWGQPVPILGILGLIGREVGLTISRITETNFGIIWLLRITKMHFVLQALVSSYCWLLTCLFSFYLFSNMITLGHDIELYAN